MAKGRDIQKSDKKKSGKTLKEKRNEKKEKKAQKGTFQHFNQMSFEADKTVRA